MTDKHVGSRIDEELHRELVERQDVNISGAIRQFLQEYATGGHSTEAALVIRRERLEDEVDDLRRKVERKERELDEINDRLEDRMEYQE